MSGKKKCRVKWCITVVQGDSRSLKLVPIESLCTSLQIVVNSNIRYCNEKVQNHHFYLLKSHLTLLQAVFLRGL